MIRIATKKDIPAILEIYAPYILNTTFTFEYTVPTLAEFTARFDAITAQFPWLVWEEDGIVLGYAYGSAPFSRAAYRWSGESSIYLSPQAQGKGIGKKLYTALEAILKAQGYRKTYAIVTSENDASLAFHQAVGFRVTAAMPQCGWKFGRLLGITWLEKDLNTDTLPDEPPVPWFDLVDLDRFFP